MARIVRLTESDLTRLVRRVIKEDELSQSADGKDCVQQIRKLYISNGFKDDGDASPYSDWSGWHYTRLTYEKRMPGGPLTVLITLRDSPEKDFDIIISNNGNDPKVANLIKKMTKDGIIGYGLSCEMAKTELFKTIKQVEQLLIQMGYKKI